MAKLYNLARMTTATTGTGTITLGSAATSGGVLFLTFAQAGVTNGDVVTYAIADTNASEIGRGTYTSSGTTLTRTVLKSTNSNTAINLSGNAQVFICPAAEDLMIVATPGCRLTLTTGVPVLTATVSAATTIYYTPYVHQFVPLYDGSSFTLQNIGGELSQATTDTTKSPAACTTNSNYDLFVWNDSGTYRCTRGPAWTSDTARGTGAGTTELERINGILLNKIAITNGPAANRGTYVGTIRTNGSSTVDYIFGALAAGGIAGVVGVWNMYNRVDVKMSVRDSTDSWTYSTATWRAANNSSTMRVSMIRGINEDAVSAQYMSLISANIIGNAQAIGIGLDSTTAFSGTTGFVNQSAALSGIASYFDLPGLGYHYLSALEYCNAGTGTFSGDGGAPLWIQTGLVVACRA